MNDVPAAGPSVRLVRLSPPAMAALVDGDLAGASREAGAALSPYLASEECTWLWRLRLRQIAEEPDYADWVARAAVAEDGSYAGQVVGHAGFHGPPDQAGMVEMGYATDPEVRRLGFARAMVRALLDWAAADPDVRTVRASISPDNAASLATIRGFGFVRTGEQWDEEDGLEEIYERPV